MPDIAGAIANMPPDNYVRVGTIKSVNPVVVNVAGGDVTNAGRLGPVAVGNRVACLRQGQSWLILGVIYPATATTP